MDSNWRNGDANLQNQINSIASNKMSIGLVNSTFSPQSTTPTTVFRINKPGMIVLYINESGLYNQLFVDSVLVYERKTYYGNSDITCLITQHINNKVTSVQSDTSALKFYNVPINTLIFSSSLELRCGLYDNNYKRRLSYSYRLLTL